MLSFIAYWYLFILNYTWLQFCVIKGQSCKTGFMWSVLPAFLLQRKGWPGGLMLVLATGAPSLSRYSSVWAMLWAAWGTLLRSQPGNQVLILENKNALVLLDLICFSVSDYGWAREDGRSPISASPFGLLKLPGDLWLWAPSASPDHCSGSCPVCWAVPVVKYPAYFCSKEIAAFPPPSLL